MIITVGGAIWAGLKTIFCKGKQKGADDAWKKNIEDEILLILKKIADLEEDYDRKEQDANDTHTEIKEGIAKINGILETMQKSLEKN